MCWNSGHVAWISAPRRGAAASCELRPDSVVLYTASTIRGTRRLATRPDFDVLAGSLGLSRPSCRSATGSPQRARREGVADQFLQPIAERNARPEPGRGPRAGAWAHASYGTSCARCCARSAARARTCCRDRACPGPGTSTAASIDRGPIKPARRRAHCDPRPAFRCLEAVRAHPSDGAPVTSAARGSRDELRVPRPMLRTAARLVIVSAARPTTRVDSTHFPSSRRARRRTLVAVFGRDRLARAAAAPRPAQLDLRACVDPCVRLEAAISRSSRGSRQVFPSSRTLLPCGRPRECERASRCSRPPRRRDPLHRRQILDCLAHGIAGEPCDRRGERDVDGPACGSDVLRISSSPSVRFSPRARPGPGAGRPACRRHVQLHRRAVLDIPETSRGEPSRVCEQAAQRSRA